MTQTTTTSTTTPTTDQHLRAFGDRADRFTSILDTVGTDSWEAPTPCEGWTARDVVAHVVDSQREFLARQGLPPGPRRPGGPRSDDPAASWRAHREHVDKVLATDGVAGREYDGFFGRTTVAATMADFYGWDLVIHGGDVARAAGLAWSIPEEEAASLHATADGWGDALYGEGVCSGPVEVGDDASTTDRLLARLGRDPRWQPA